MSGQFQPPFVGAIDQVLHSVAPLSTETRNHWVCEETTLVDWLKQSIVCTLTVYACFAGHPKFTLHSVRYARRSRILCSEEARTNHSPPRFYARLPDQAHDARCFLQAATLVYSLPKKSCKNKFVSLSIILSII